jgi:hypothetical protein
MVKTARMAGVRVWKRAEGWYQLVFIFTCHWAKLEMKQCPKFSAVLTGTLCFFILWVLTIFLVKGHRNVLWKIDLGKIFLKTILTAVFNQQQNRCKNASMLFFLLCSKGFKFGKSEIDLQN